MDSNDYRTHTPDVVHRNVMSQLMAEKKGIILFHDIQPSTAGALRHLLDELAAKNFRVVHVVPKAPVVTLPEFDAQADKEFARRKVAVAAQPLAPRSMTWTAGPPPQGQGQSVPPANGQPFPTSPSAQQQESTAAQQASAPMAAPLPVERPSRTRSSEDIPWQKRVFDQN